MDSERLKNTWIQIKHLHDNLERAKADYERQCKIIRSQIEYEQFLIAKYDDSFDEDADLSPRERMQRCKFLVKFLEKCGDVFTETPQLDKST